MIVLNWSYNTVVKRKSLYFNELPNDVSSSDKNLYKSIFNMIMFNNLLILNLEHQFNIVQPLTAECVNITWYSLHCHKILCKNPENVVQDSLSVLFILMILSITFSFMHYSFNLFQQMKFYFYNVVQSWTSNVLI